MQFRIYRPQKNNGGAASIFEVRTLKKELESGKSVDRHILVINSAPQVPSDNQNAAFAWQEKEKTTFVQLNEFEAAEIILVLRGTKNAIGPLDKEGKAKGLYHQTNTGNALVKFEYNEERQDYYLTVSTKRGDASVRVNHGLSLSEGVVLERLLQDFISLKYGWNK